ncbi:MAG: hypothetical protein IJS09_05210 [Treponema sp.]|nr:hypothetical protein [Treponema sp.]
MSEIGDWTRCARPLKATLLPRFHSRIFDENSSAFSSRYTRQPHSNAIASVQKELSEDELYKNRREVRFDFNAAVLTKRYRPLAHTLKVHYTWYVG